MTLLNEREILDFLMTSDFQEGFNHEETRFLLLKFRYYYRLQHAKTESLNYQLDEKEAKISELNEELDNIRETLKLEQERLNNEINRKLTWSERLFGKKEIIKWT